MLYAVEQSPLAGVQQMNSEDPRNNLLRNQKPGAQWSSVSTQRRHVHHRPAGEPTSEPTARGSRQTESPDLIQERIVELETQLTLCDSYVRRSLKLRNQAKEKVRASAGLDREAALREFFQLDRRFACRLKERNSVELEAHQLREALRGGRRGAQ